VKLRPIALLALTLAHFGVACADPSAGGDGSSSPSVAHGTAPEDLLLRWGYEGGFTPPEYQLTNLPSFSLYGDGTIVRPGPQIEIYPGPAVPALEVAHADEEAIASILEAPVSFFFADAPGGGPGELGGMSEGNSTNFGVDFISSAEGLQLNRAFSRISDTKVRRKLVELVKALASDEVE